MPPKAKKTEAKKTKKGKEKAKAPPPPPTPPEVKKDCGRILTKRQTLRVDPSGEDCYDLGCRLVQSYSDLFCNEQGPEPPPEPLTFAPRHPCIESWAQTKFEQSLQVVEDPEEKKESGDNGTPNASKIPGSSVKAPSTIKTPSSGRSSGKDKLNKEATPEKVDQIPPENIDLLQNSINQGVIPDQIVLKNLYNFTTEQLYELQEAFFYFATYMYPKPDRKKKDKTEVLPTDTQNQKPLDKGGKKGKGKKEGKKSPEASPRDGKGKGGKGKKDKSPPAQEEEKPAESLLMPILGLNRCSLARCLRSLDQNPSEFDLGVMLRMAGSEPINLTSFLYAVHRWTLRDLECEKYNLFEAFKTFDQCSNCRISIHQLRCALECYGEPLTPEDVDELWGFSDPPDRDGMIDIAPLFHRLTTGPPLKCPPETCQTKVGPGGDQEPTEIEPKKKEKEAKDKKEKKGKEKK